MPRRGMSIDYKRRTALYRLYDVDGRLLYVGITFDLRNRWADHAQRKSWWEAVVRRDVEWHETRYSAEAAECAAILAERPAYNIVGAVEVPTPAAPKVRRIRPAARDAADDELKATAKRWRKSKAALQRADAELCALITEGRRQGLTLAVLAQLTGFSRDRISRIAPARKG